MSFENIYFDKSRFGSSVNHDVANRSYRIPSILSALQPWVSLGLLSNQSSLLSVFRLLHPLLYLEYFLNSATSSSIYLKRGLPFLLPMNSLPSTIFLGIAPTSILFICPNLT
jgi:hypothetical protein